KDRPRKSDSFPIERYRLEVGSQHEATPREIVGAIANEAGLDGNLIGRIEIFEDHSTVELPAGMPKDVYQHLRRVFVRGQKLDLSLLSPADSQPTRKPGKKRAKKK
ncbi:MAG: DbpA RNA binding domain-containing protein, partial [Candidatus Thiodiazotropha sp.]